jgi:hypothetical protein
VWKVWKLAIKAPSTRSWVKRALTGEAGKFKVKRVLEGKEWKWRLPK